MNEKILNIKKSVFEVNTDDRVYDCEGIIITTDKQAIRLGISNFDQCCEEFGYLTTEDDLTEFHGAILTGLNIMDDARKLKEIAININEEGLLLDDETSTIFVNLETSRGTLQFVAYNNHNGYYGHKVKIDSIQLNVERTI